MTKYIIGLIIGLALAVGAVSYSTSTSVHSLRVSPDGSVIANIRGAEAKKLRGSAYEEGKVLVRHGSTHNGQTVTITSDLGSLNTNVDVTWMRPFMLTDEEGAERWFLEFNLSSRAGADTTSDTIYTISGVDFANTANTHFTALACQISRSGGGDRTCEAWVRHDNDNIIGGDIVGGGYDRNSVAGIVPLETKPDWVP